MPTPDAAFSPRFTLRRWRRRPVLYLVAMTCSAAPLTWLVHTISTTGLQSLWPLPAPLLGGLLAMAVVLGADRGGEPAPAAWIERDLANAELWIPRVPRDPPELYAVAGSTVWTGWVLGLLVQLGLLWTQEPPAAEHLQRLLFLGAAAAIPALWMGALLPALLRGSLWVPTIRSPPTRVTVSARTLTVDGASFLLGRADQTVRREPVGTGVRLTLSPHAEHVVVEGPRAHIDVLQERIEHAPHSGSADDIELRWTARKDEAGRLQPVLSRATREEQDG